MQAAMRSTAAVTLAVLALIVASAGCSRPGSGPNGAAAYGDAALKRGGAPPSAMPLSMEAASPAGIARAAAAELRPERKRMRRAELALVVRDVTATATRARALADSSGGFVADMDSGGAPGTPYARLTLRVPAERLDGTLTALKGLALRVTHEGSNLEDRTAEYVDTNARLRTLKATETELLGLLADSRRRGAKTDDIMAVYRELTEIRGQIESMQGQLDVIDREVALSTLTLTLTADVAARPLSIGPWRPGDTLRNSTRTLLVLLRGLGDLAIFVVVALLPVALILGMPTWLLVRALRRRRAQAKHTSA